MHAYICQIQRQSHSHNAIPNGDWQNLIFIPIRFWVFAIVYLRQHSLFSRHICVCRKISLGFIRSSFYYDAPLSGANRWKYLEINYTVIFHLMFPSITHLESPVLRDIPQGVFQNRLHIAFPVCSRRFKITISRLWRACSDSGQYRLTWPVCTPSDIGISNSKETISGRAMGGLKRGKNPQISEKWVSRFVQNKQ